MHLSRTLAARHKFALQLVMQTLHAQKRSIPWYHPWKVSCYILSSVYRIPRSVPTKLTPPPCLPSVKVYTIVKENNREAAKFRFILSASSTNVLQRWTFFCKSATFVSLNYRILLCDFDKIQHPREKMALSII